MIILPFIEKWTTLKHPEIPSYTYVISNIGNVKLQHDMTDVKPYLSTNGRVYIALKSISNKITMFPLGNILAISFDIIPDEEIVGKPIKIRYKNDNPLDNRPENIEWVEDVEEWKDMSELGFNSGLWKISSHGNFYGTRYNKFLKQRIGRTDYLRVGGLAIGNKHSIEKYSHRLIAEAFVENPKPSEYKIVNHINGNKLYNHYMNLEWVNISLNCLHASYMGLIDIKYGEKNGSTKLSEDVVRKVCQLLLKYNGNVYTVSQKIGVNIYAVKAIRNGRSWRHISVEYFPLGFFIKKAKSLDIKYVKIICEVLLKNGMDVSKTYEEIKDVICVERSKIVDIARKNPTCRYLMSIFDPV